MTGFAVAVRETTIRIISNLRAPTNRIGRIANSEPRVTVFNELVCADNVSRVGLEGASARSASSPLGSKTPTTNTTPRDRRAGGDVSLLVSPPSRIFHRGSQQACARWRARPSGVGWSSTGIRGSEDPILSRSRSTRGSSVPEQAKTNSKIRKGIPATSSPEAGELPI